MDGLLKAMALPLLLLLHLRLSAAVQLIGPVGALTVHFPKESGCFVRTPSGCPKHSSFNSYDWKHELYGELYKNAKVDGQMCEVKRRRHVNAWCGSDDVEMLFIAPLEQGCYFRLPMGCPRHPLFNTSKWKREEYGETYRKARENRTVCEQARRAFLQSWCGTKEVQMLFVAPEYQGLAPLAARLNHRGNPQEPGCFIRSPKGCQNPNYYTVDWKHDVFAERYTWANVNRTACEVLRKERVARICGNKVEAKFVSAGSVSPAEPGCFVRALDGCPRHPDLGTEWVLDPLSENSSEVKENRTLCEVERKERLAEWCGTQQVEMYFFPPLEGGCYMRTPSGCPNHPAFGSLAWRHEEFGEKFTDAKTNRTVCEITRKERVTKMCGVDDAETLFIPGATVDEERLEVPDAEMMIVPGATADDTLFIPETAPNAEMQDDQDDPNAPPELMSDAGDADEFDARLLQDLPSAQGVARSLPSDTERLGGPGGPPGAEAESAAGTTTSGAETENMVNTAMSGVEAESVEGTTPPGREVENMVGTAAPVAEAESVAGTTPSGAEVENMAGIATSMAEAESVVRTTTSGMEDLEILRAESLAVEDDPNAPHEAMSEPPDADAFDPGLLQDLPSASTLGARSTPADSERPEWPGAPLGAEAGNVAGAAPPGAGTSGAEVEKVAGTATSGVENMAGTATDDIAEDLEILRAASLAAEEPVLTQDAEAEV